ncbi:MAG: GlsB/YeaQ/YmgE family stress response membrane protein [Candidatus Omnitrophota bacterium]|jgi:uncharacterized membrane protein YeaQ/YmgE (transglycosylase-associated protein family)
MENNGLGYWVWFLLIGAVIGWLAGLIVRGRGFGIIGDIVVGVVGAMLGGWMGRVIGIYPGSSIGAFLMALVGAVLLVGLTRFIKRIAA